MKFEGYDSDYMYSIAFDSDMNQAILRDHIKFYV